MARRPYVPLRADPEKEDEQDAERVEYVVRRFHSQDHAVLGYSRMVEEHIRMLAGRHWDRWSNVFGRFVDVLQWVTEDERRVRAKPVMDYLGYWYVLTLSKAIENPASITWMPSTSDRNDALLAEVMDPIWKTLFEECDMFSNVMRAAGWGLVAGETYYGTRVDFSSGPKKQLIAPALLSLQHPQLGLIERVAEAVPYDAKGNPLAKLMEDPEAPGEFGYDVTGEPYEDREGQPKVDVLNPLMVRAQWGSHIKWRDKQWIAQEWYLTPEQVYEQYGVECQPDHSVGTDESGPGYLERMLFGTGYFGTGPDDQGPGFGGSAAEGASEEEGYVRGITYWEKPVKDQTDPQDEKDPGGRLLVVAPSSRKTLWDSRRPFNTECAGPIRRVPFIEMPGRPRGTTNLASLVPLQRRLNRVDAHISQHTNLCTDPILFVHEAAGIDEDEWVSRPGIVVTHGYNGPGNPAYFLAPPPLSPDVWQYRQAIIEQLFTIGSMAGNQSAPPTPSSSGALVEQLRVNADRPLTPLTMNLALGLADVAKDILAILPTIWTEEKLIAYAGQDNVVRTVKVLPEMFDGSVNVRPNLESAAAESRDARRQRLIQLFQLGAFGVLEDPVERPRAIAQLLELINFPDLIRSARPGGVDRIMAEHNVGRLVRGDPAEAIPLLEVYNFDIHRMVVENEMKGPEHLNLDPEIQMEFELLRAAIDAAQQAQAMNLIAKGLPLASAEAAARGSTAASEAAANPTPPAANAPGGQKRPGGNARPPASAPASAAA